MKPEEIEKKSMELIEREMKTRPPRDHAPIIRRVIHATADFEYEYTIKFSESAVAAALKALRGGMEKTGATGETGYNRGVCGPASSQAGPQTPVGIGDVLSAAAETETGRTIIVTDTNMALAGINKAALSRLGCEAVCFMADSEVAAEAAARGATRAAVSMEKAARMQGRLIFAIGNAPTALLRLRQLIDEGAVRPELVIGVPVGFVNVVDAKEEIMNAGVPYIVARGRKGGSTVAAAICNALLYMAEDKTY